MSLARRSVHSSVYNVVSQGLQIVILLFRSVMLARLLSPEVFGLYTFAQAIIYTTQIIPSFGLGSAYIHRSPETEHPNAPGVYLTLITVFSLIWALLLAGGASILLDYQQRWVLWVLVAITFVSQLVAPAQAILIKRVLFERLAVLDFATATLSTVIAVAVAWKGGGIWSLLSVDIISVLILTVGLYLIRPAWRLQFAWSLPTVSYFLKFGSRTVLAGLLSQANDRFDDIWTGYFIGNIALGFYSRAYTFANYPRRILANPVNAVAMGTYAEAKYNRKGLSQAFFRVNAAIIRTGFLFAGALWLVSFEFVYLILGEKWVPMLGAFRLMIAYALVDPMKTTVANLFISIGHPELLVRTRSIQLIVLVAGLFILGPHYGISGVAIAANIMAMAGIGLLLWQARRFVDFSILRLFTVPLLAIIAGIVAALCSVLILGEAASYWQSGFVKLLVLVLVYVGIVLLLEWHQIYEMLQLVHRMLFSTA